MTLHYERKRVLIWGKTYPELSSTYTETVCTAGVLEDGTPVRLYPVPLRYLDREGQYSLYDWIEAPMAKSSSDTRPESFKVDATAIRVVGSVATDEHGWRERANIVFRDPSWQFEGMEQLKAAQEARRMSFGVVVPGEIAGVQLRKKGPDERAVYERKAKELAARTDMFHPDYKDLEFRDHEIVLRWRCQTPCPTCRSKPHAMQVLDWGLTELARKNDWDWEKAKSKLEDLVSPGSHDLRLFLGNTKAHQKNFLVVGLWYPKVREQASFL